MFSSSKNKIFTLLGLLSILLALFAFSGIASAQSGVLPDNFPPDKAKSLIDKYISQVKTLMEDNTKLDGERQALVKKRIENTYASSQSTEEEKSTVKQSIIEVDSKIAANNAVIESKHQGALIMISTLAANKEPESVLNEYKKKVNDAFNTTADGSTEENACFSWGILNVGACVLNVEAWMANIIIYVCGTLLWLAGVLFDVSIYMSITKAKDWYFTSAGIEGAWTIMRDFANIFFVFVLLYVAIGTILDLRGAGDPKKMITNVIIIALLVNFSGFFVRVVVDASNVIAFEFYSSMTGDRGWSKMGNLGSNLVSKIGPEYYLVEKGSELGDKVGDKMKLKGTSYFSILSETIFAILTILIASIVLLIASILFIVRTIVLIFVYMVSPFAFMSQIIPSSRFNYFGKWLNALVKQAFFAPGFLAPLYLVFVLLDANGIFGSRLTEIESPIGLIFGGAGTAAMTSILILGLLIACIFIALKFGKAVAEVAPGVAQKAAQLASRPLSRYGGRVVGRVGAKLAQTETGKAIGESWNTGRLSRVRQSWDTGILKTARETEAGKKAEQAIRNPLSTIVGARPFNKEVEERAGKRLEDLRRYKTPEEQSRFIEGLAGVTQKEEFDFMYAKLSPEERSKVELAARKEVKAHPMNSGARRALARLEEDRKRLKGKEAQETAAELIKKSKETEDKFAAMDHLDQSDLDGAYKLLSKDDRVELEKRAQGAGGVTPLTPAERARVAKLTTSRGKLKAGEQKAVTQATASDTAFERIRDAHTRGVAIEAEDIRSINKEQILGVSVDILSKPEVAVHLTPQQLKALNDSDDIGSADRGRIRASIEAEIERAKQSTTAEGRLKPETTLQRVQREAAGLPPQREAITQPGKLPPHLEKLDAYFRLGGSGF